MTIAQLISELSRPSAYPFAVDQVEVRQTHISAVFLAGDRAFKIKKPVALGFLDFSSLEQRRHFCDEEVRLNRRLAPDVYLAVLPVTRDKNGCRFGGTGEIVEWAVEMLRLPDEASLERRLISGQARGDFWKSLAERVAQFHRDAQSGPEIAALGRFEVVAANVRENFTQTINQVGVTVSRSVYQRLLTGTEHHLDLLRPLIDARAQHNVPRDTHGDLHLDHVYVFPEERLPRDIVIIDCIEFNERFRYADPVSDMAFLVMDLKDHGRHALADQFARAYFQAAGDDEGRALLPFYVAYRSLVRAKVEGMKLFESEIPEEAKQAARQRSRGHWLLALGELVRPDERPMMLLIGGLPGTGKSTLARQLADRQGFSVIRSDVVRKELAGLSPDDRATEQFGMGIYSPQATEQTYAECLKRAETLLWNGHRVVVDANFPSEQLRRRFLDAAVQWGVPGWFVRCTAPSELVRKRLESRKGDASDANWTIYEQAVRQWEPLGAETRLSALEISTDGDLETVIADLWRRLEAATMG